MFVILICAFAVAVGFVVGAIFAVERGRAFERRNLWHRMLTDRTLGHHVLEEVGKAHGAKVELVEL